MMNWLSPTNGAKLRFWSSNPTCAGPHLCRTRCHNLARIQHPAGGSKPGQFSNGLSRRGQRARPRGVACRLGCCASLPLPGEASISPLRDHPRAPCGYARGTVPVFGAITRGKGPVPQTDEVPRRLGLVRVRSTYKSVTKGSANAAERIGCPLSRPP